MPVAANSRLAALHATLPKHYRNHAGELAATGMNGSGACGSPRSTSAHKLKLSASQNTHLAFPQPMLPPLATISSSAVLPNGGSLTAAGGGTAAVRTAAANRNGESPQNLISTLDLLPSQQPANTQPPQLLSFPAAAPAVTTTTAAPALPTSAAAAGVSIRPAAVTANNSINQQQLVAQVDDSNELQSSTM